MTKDDGMREALQDTCQHDASALMVTLQLLKGVCYRQTKVDGVICIPEEARLLLAILELHHPRNISWSNETLAIRYVPLIASVDTSRLPTLDDRRAIIALPAERAACLVWGHSQMEA